MSATSPSRPARRPPPPAEVSWFVHEAHGAPPVRVWLLTPRRPPATDAVTIVMPGTMRNAEDYARSWRAFGADRHVAIPEFSRTDWPGSRRYALGNVVSGRGARRVRTPRSRWAFTAVETIHERVRRRFGLQAGDFDLWGHSAGAQFVHRMALFCPDAAVRTWIAAGAGWYTAPDPATAFPYGLGDLPGVTAGQLDAFTATPLVFMRGSRDTVRDAHLRTSPGAERQGANRFERAAYMVRAGRRADPRCAWRLLDVDGAGHEPSKMAAAAQDLLREAR